MENNIDEIREKLFKAIDPMYEYSLDDFNNEYNVNHTMNINNYKTAIKFINKSNNPNPEYAKVGDSGFDIRAYVDEPVILMPGKRRLIPTGLYFELPPNMELQVRPRSGLALKNGVTVLNSPGTVDSGYVGEVGVILINHGYEDFIVNNGDRIAQGVIASVVADNNVRFVSVDELNKTERGESGFGSTGIK